MLEHAEEWKQILHKRYFIYVAKYNKNVTTPIVLISFIKFNKIYPQV